MYKPGTEYVGRDTESRFLFGPRSNYTEPIMLSLLFQLFLVSSASAIGHITRSGAELQLDGKRWTAAGANVYWLGLDENVIPPAGEPFYEPYNASYPTKGRITEVMSTLKIMGARTIRSQTLGVSVGNPLSLMPELGRVNEDAFDTIDWTVYQARKYGIRIFVPLVGFLFSIHLIRWWILT